MFHSVHPILGSQDIQKSIAFYTNFLGFTLSFRDDQDNPNYIGFRRGDVLLHMQFQYEHEMSQTRLRFKISDPDAVYLDYLNRGVEITDLGIRDTDWGTREFSLWDPDRNALNFYKNL